MSKQEELKIFRPYQTHGLQRMGNKHDGGYVVHFPSLQFIDCLLTYGVGYNTKFEEDFHAVTNKPVYAFDPTMAKFKYVLNDFKKKLFAHGIFQTMKWLSWKGLQKTKRLQKQHIYFIQEGLSGTNSEQFKTLDYHLKKYNLIDKKLFLKIDIEGAEYEVLNDETFYLHLNNVVQMVFEFHWLENGIDILMKHLKKFERTHSLVHIHANNFGNTFNYHGTQVPYVIEVTYLHNSFITEKKVSSKKYPIEGLDAPCTTRRKELIPDFF